MVANGNAPNRPTRVLIFDKDQDWCGKLSELFLMAGNLHCDTEHLSFSSCLDKSRDNPFNYAIVNYHSLDDPGRELLAFNSEFPTTQIVLLGDHDDQEMITYLWPPRPIAHYNYGSKDARPITELRKLVLLLDDLRRKLGNIHVIFKEGVEQLLDDYSKYRFQSRTEAQRDRKNASLSTMKQELQAVIEALFSSRRPHTEPIAKEITVEPFVESGRSSSCLFKLTPKILLGGGVAKSAVLKFGPKDDVSKESENYDRFVEWFLTIDQTVRKVGYEEANWFSGLLYAYPRDMAGGYQPFARYIRDRSVEHSETVIANMFNTGNRHWLAVDGNGHVDSDFAVFQNYYITHVLHASIPEMRDNHLKKLEKEIRAIEKKRKTEIMEIDDGSISFPAFSLRVPNPVARLGTNQIIKALKITVVHGDLHAHNILVDENGRHFFIDFFYTGFGDIYRDFIELEISIRYDLFSSKEIQADQRFTASDSQDSNIEGMKSLVNFERELLKCSTEEGRELKSKQILNDPRLLKAFRLIMKVRQFARENCPEKWPLYFAGLALSSLKGLKYFYPADVKMHRLLTSGLYLEYIDKKNALDSVH